MVTNNQSNERSNKILRFFQINLPIEIAKVFIVDAERTFKIQHMSIRCLLYVYTTNFFTRKTKYIIYQSKQR